MFSGSDVGDRAFGFGFNKYILGVSAQANPADNTFRDVMGSTYQQVMSDTNIVVSGQTGDSGSGKTGVYGSIETKPTNYTIRVWKRTV